LVTGAAGKQHNDRRQHHQHRRHHDAETAGQLTECGEGTLAFLQDRAKHRSRRRVTPGLDDRLAGRWGGLDSLDALAKLVQGPGESYQRQQDAGCRRSH
jgi:hypothetical protein